MPVTVTVQFTAKPGKRPDLLEFMKGVQAVAIEAGCHSIAVYADLEDENRAFEVEYWENQAAHQAFVKGAAEAGAFAPFDDLLAAPFVISYGEPFHKTDR